MQERHHARANIRPIFWWASLAWLCANAPSWSSQPARKPMPIWMGLSPGEQLWISRLHTVRSERTFGCMQANAGSADLPACGRGDDKEDPAGALPARSFPGRPLHHDPARPHPCPRHARPGAKQDFYDLFTSPQDRWLIITAFQSSLMHSMKRCKHGIDLQHLPRARPTFCVAIFSMLNRGQLGFHASRSDELHRSSGGGGVFAHISMHTVLPSVIWRLGFLSIVQACASLALEKEPAPSVAVQGCRRVRDLHTLGCGLKSFKHHLHPFQLPKKDLAAVSAARQHPITAHNTNL